MVLQLQSTPRVITGGDAMTRVMPQGQRGRTAFELCISFAFLFLSLVRALDIKLINDTNRDSMFGFSPFSSSLSCSSFSPLLFFLVFSETLFIGIHCVNIAWTLISMARVWNHTSGCQIQYSYVNMRISRPCLTGSTFCEPSPSLI